MSVNDTLGTGESLGNPAREAFAGWPMIIGWVAMLVFAFHACTHMVAAGDTWVAMACGRHFVNHGVDTVEPFSANSHKAGPTAEEVQKWPQWAQWITDKVGLDTVRRWHPTGWVNQNWLTHVIFYRLTTSLGSESEPYYDALVLWKFAVYILAAAALYGTSRIYGVNRALAVIFVCFALFIGRSFFDVRPAGFSNLLVAVFMLVLALASYRNALFIWLLVPLIVFWSNVHGGYIYAFIVLVPFIGWHAIMNLPRRWMVAAYSILLWLTLYGMAYRLLGHEGLRAVAATKDAMFYLVVLAIGGSVALAVHRKVDDRVVLVCHIVASCILFLILLSRFFPAVDTKLSRQNRGELEIYIAGSRLAYLAVFSLAMLVGAVVASLKDKVVLTMSWRGVLHSLAASAVAFVAMVVFNPFHLTNLTHTFEISVSKHAERWRDVHEWHRAFDWTNPVGTAAPFLAMYILAWLVVVAWVVAYVYVSRARVAAGGKKAKTPMAYAWPRMDLSLLVIAAMTIYMAIRSRRFIPIAGFAACPILALLIDCLVRALAAMVQARGTGTLEVPSIPTVWRRGLLVAGGVVVLAFGVVWGLRFYTVYLDSWPADYKYTSVFMRMTASDAKPFAACEFIRVNKLRGKMFNYWTEGGFIAWGQDPDPNTGKVPLQLFMDGRAQAAYDVNTFDLWTNIMSGGPSATPALMAGRRANRNECLQIAAWIGEQLKKQNVWVVLMPNGQFGKPFVDGIECSQTWRTVYMDDKQRLFADTTTPEGEKLFRGMFTGETVFPDEYSRNLTVGHSLLVLSDVSRKKRGLEMLVEAMKAMFAPAPLYEMLTIGDMAVDLRPRINEVCEQYVQDFEKNKASYSRQNGFNLRLEAIRLAMIRMQQIALTNQDKASAEEYARRKNLYEDERERILRTRRW
ncbi:MAG: hypothetical protein KBE65_14005 [Phycisphaerae bacterium]|nr:hypothetical protein [Phycisphaerae bacterium]